VRHLAQNEIPLEVCPTSNIRTGVYPSIYEHPLKRLQDAGVVVTLNTDDPTFFECQLTDEYEAAAALGIEESGIHEIIQNGFRSAFLPKELKAKYVAMCDYSSFC
jgi:aminodeoxyfutalosine deaminase